MVIKKIAAVISVVFMVFATAACSPGPDGSNAPASDSALNSIVPAVPVSAFASDTAAGSEDITLRYISHVAASIDPEMIKAFEDMHPNIHIELVESQEEMPDIFLSMHPVPEVVLQDLAYNATGEASSDPEYQNILKPLRDSGLINGHVYGMPYAMDMRIIAVNRDIFTEMNAKPPGYSYTLEDFRAAMAQTTGSGYFGSDLKQVYLWGASALSDNMTYFNFDGDKYHYSGNEFAQILTFYRDAVEKGQLLDNENQHNFLPDDVVWAWADGYTAFSDAQLTMLSFMHENSLLSFNADALPMFNEKVEIQPSNFIYIGKNTQHPHEAYEFAKWMTFSREGQLHRLSLLAAAEGGKWNMVPITPGVVPEVDAAFLKDYEWLPAFKDVYALLSAKPQNVIIDPYYSIPGFSTGYEADTGVLNKKQESLSVSSLIISIFNGEHPLAEYAELLDKISNEEYQKALTALSGK